LCLGVNALALVLNENLGKLGCLEWWWLGGIYSPQPPNNRWGRLLSMGAPDTVRCASHVTQPLGFGSSRPLEALSSSVTGQSGATPDRYCSLSGAHLTSARTVLHSSDVRCRCSRPLRWIAVTPLVHRTVRRIIAERAGENPRVAGLRLYGPSAPDSPVSHTRAHSASLFL
jgi:hypothetical protein